jgi:hypothetical protein
VKRSVNALERALNRIGEPTVRKIVVMSKWERGELSADEARHLIRVCGLESV